MNSARLRMQVEQAMNEAIDFFLLLSSVSLSLEQPQQLLKEIQILCTLIEENKTQGLFEDSGT